MLRWEGQQPIYNPRFIAFATYYLFRPRACRPYHPNDKPHVELSFRSLRISFFNGRDFYDLDDLKAQLARWMTGIDDERPQRKKQRRTPFELHAEEQPHLVARPRHAYDTARVVYRVCVTELLPVRITQNEIFVYAQNLELVARHELRQRSAGEDVVASGHRPKPDRGPGLDQLRVAYRELGDGADDFLVALERAQSRSAAYHARQILALRARYPTDDVVAAMDHARQYGAFDYHAIERILVARAAPRRLDEYVTDATENKLAAIVRQSRTEPRDLSAYDGLPNWSSPPNTGEPACPNHPASGAERATAEVLVEVATAAIGKPPNRAGPGRGRPHAHRRRAGPVRAPPPRTATREPLTTSSTATVIWHSPTSQKRYGL